MPDGGCGIITCNLRGHATGKYAQNRFSITPQVSGRIVELNIKDNQLVNAGDLLLTIDKTPFQIAELNAQAQLAKRNLTSQKPITKRIVVVISPQNFISAEELDTANLNVKAMQASVDAAQATLKQAQWQTGANGNSRPGEWMGD
ncbi:HlyD-family secretion protein [Escherichia coli]|uniref:HlyD-family secretion protein n=1 Tax=Escherichia coli TaxID=562 RepID=A0A376Y9P0_ECOLX|nr:HlyD-family secretion protein [Escherichia coli]